MQELWQPSLTQRIESFIGRKSREYPELDLSHKWHDYEYEPHNISESDT